MKQYRVRPGADRYGFAIGILLVDCKTPFIPGDVGNATTYPYPVLYETVPGVTLDRLINQGDETLVDGIIEVARKMQGQGVRAITSDCGYMVRYQQKVAAALDIPVILSSLVQLPLLERTIGPERKIGVICANKQRLTPQLLEIAGLSAAGKAVIYGLEDKPHFRAPMLDEIDPLEPEKIGPEVVDTALAMIEAHPEVGPILLECSNLPPYAHLVQEATGRPVFDFTTLINLYCNAGIRKPFQGFY